MSYEKSLGGKMEIILTLFLILWFIGFSKNLYLFYRDYFFRNEKRDYVFFYMLQTILVVSVLWLIFSGWNKTSDRKLNDKLRYGKATLQEKEMILGQEWAKGTVVTPASKKMRVEKVKYISPVEKVLFHDIFVTELKIESFVPAIDTIDNIEITLAENSMISNFPCSKNAKVKILADGMLESCKLSKDIFVGDVKVKKGARVELINANNGVHPTFKMTAKKDYDRNESYVPIWNMSVNRLEKETIVSGVKCLKGSFIEVLDNEELLKCSKIGAMELDGFKVEKGCSILNINPLQEEIKILIDLWDISCSNISIGETTFSNMTFRYSIIHDRVRLLNAYSSTKKEHTFEDLVKGESNDSH